MQPSQLARHEHLERLSLRYQAPHEVWMRESGQGLPGCHPLVGRVFLTQLEIDLMEVVTLKSLARIPGYGVLATSKNGTL